jgi:hypothetical protein
MKTIKLIRGGVVLIATLALSPFATAQTTVTTTRDNGTAVVQTTTTRVGRVGTITPDSLVMDAAAGTEPIPYVRTSRTVFVDETGATVPIETVRAGVPVTVHYTRDADRYLADRVVVHRKVVEAEPSVVERSTVVEQPARKPVVEQKKTTTTTTTSEPTRVRVKDRDDDDDDD